MEHVSKLPVTATAVSVETLAAATVSAAIETTSSTTTTTNTTSDSDGDGDVYGDCNSTNVVDCDPENDNYRDSGHDGGRNSEAQMAAIAIHNRLSHIDGYVIISGFTIPAKRFRTHSSTPRPYCVVFDGLDWIGLD